MKTLTQEIYDEGYLYWFDGEHIDEMPVLSDVSGRTSHDDRLFTVDGPIEGERQISQLILQEISGCVTTNLAKQVSGLFAAAPH